MSRCDFGHDPINAIRGRLSNFAFFQTDNGNSIFEKARSFIGVIVLSPSMPVISVALHRKIGGWNKNINMVTKDRIFRNENNTAILQAFLDSRFNRVGLYAIMTVTRYAAILMTFFQPRRMGEKLFSTARARHHNLCISANFRTITRTILGSVSSRTAAPFSGFFPASLALENMRAAAPFTLSLSRKIVFGTASFGAKFYLAIKVLGDCIFLSAIQAFSKFCFPLPGMQISNLMSCVARYGTEFSYRRPARFYLEGLTAPLACNRNHAYIITQGV